MFPRTKNKFLSFRKRRFSGRRNSKADEPESKFMQNGYRVQKDLLYTTAGQYLIGGNDDRL